MPILVPRRGGLLGLRSRLLASFEGLIVYHAARPISVRTFYERGLLLGDRATQMIAAREIFLSGRFPELTADALEASGDRFTLNEDGQAFVSLDSRGFVDGAGHYLIYGSEHLCAIAAGLSELTGRDYRQVLKEFGVPTVFRMKLPLEWVNEHELGQLVQLLHEWIPWVRRKRDAPSVDFTFRLRRALPADCVLSHVHPSRIVDPLLGMTQYEYAGTACSCRCRVQY
jgi:hypothetical protein